MKLMLKRSAVSVLALGVVACGGEDADMAEGNAEMAAEQPAEMMESEAEMSSEAAPGAVSLQAVVENERRADRAARDEYRHPVETLEFFGLEPDMTVVEIWPGGGWYTDILAPYLAAGGGTFYAAHFDPDTAQGYQVNSLENFRSKYVDNPDVYGNIQMTAHSADKKVAPDGSADMVLTFRNVHNWVMGGFAEQSFENFYDALKPGGILGVVDHRLPEDADSEREKSSGYVKESSVIAMAEAAGFELVGKSEINANPADTADHAFGVWTLAPSNRRPQEGQEAPEGFDAEAIEAIGESDRMTLKFQKPVLADGALME